MPNPYFRFKQFTVRHDRCAMKVTTDACLFGAWCAEEIKKESKQHQNALEIGTGTGLLSLMTLQKNDLEIDAIEIDDAAAEQARENTDTSPWKNQIKIHRDDALSFQYKKQYNLLISNPPFYENELESGYDRKNKAHHGHTLRLSQLFYLINSHVKLSGTFYLLLPYKRVDEVQTLLQAQNLFIEKKVLVGQSTLHTPFRVMIKGKLQPSSAIETYVLSVKNEHQEYTSEFTSLLKDYYLYL